MADAQSQSSVAETKDAIGDGEVADRGIAEYYSIGTDGIKLIRPDQRMAGIQLRKQMELLAQNRANLYSQGIPSGETMPRMSVLDLLAEGERTAYLASFAREQFPAETTRPIDDIPKHTIDIKEEKAEEPAMRSQLFAMIGKQMALDSDGKEFDLIATDDSVHRTADFLRLQMLERVKVRLKHYMESIPKGEVPSSQRVLDVLLSDPASSTKEFWDAVTGKAFAISVSDDGNTLNATCDGVAFAEKRRS